MKKTVEDARALALAAKRRPSKEAKTLFDSANNLLDDLYKKAATDDEKRFIARARACGFADQAEQLWHEATIMFLGQEISKPGEGAFNLAAQYAFRGDAEATKAWLERARQTGRLGRKVDLVTDTGIEAVVGKEWWADFLKRAF